ncbi:hypothetical protein [Streptomyces sp. 891-h]|uniref:hypothetical protein n=1 Tax=Streptomyces sp. 891-h TaxID=2720714 RepID=UPI001FAAC301|nr:hypothetical protein [Streptomyces sp. 891-h]UNZ22320.1 hypothetical protein HC362_34710 [Streptomyces sp. 891-h]
MTTKSAGRVDDTRVTADLPPADFALLVAARKRDKATTSEVTRALLRLQAQDPEMVERVSEEIEALRIEKAQAELEARRARRDQARQRKVAA